MPGQDAAPERWAAWALGGSHLCPAAVPGGPGALPRTWAVCACACTSLPAGSDLAASPLSFQIASSLSQELRALVFGVNTFLATVLKTIITLVVSDKRGLGLPVRSQVSPRFGLTSLRRESSGACPGQASSWPRSQWCCLSRDPDHRPAEGGASPSRPPGLSGSREGGVRGPGGRGHSPACAAPRQG